MRLYDWPANVVELDEVIGWAVLTAEARGSATIEVEDLPVELRGSANRDCLGHGADASAEAAVPAVEPASTAAEIETRLILEAAERHCGRRQAMAAELGMSPNTLWRRLRELGMVRRYRRSR